MARRRAEAKARVENPGMSDKGINEILGAPKHPEPDSRHQTDNYKQIQKLGQQLEILPVGQARHLLATLLTHINSSGKKGRLIWRGMRDEGVNRRISVAAGAIRRMQLRNLSRAWERYQEWYADMRNSMFFCSGAIRRMQNRKLSMAWEQWQVTL